MSKHFTKKQPNKAVFSNLNEAECLELEQIQLCVCVCVLVAQSCPTLATLWTVARQAPPSTEFSRQEYWSRLPFPSAGDLPDPGIEPRSPALLADSLPAESPGEPSRRDTGSLVIKTKEFEKELDDSEN